MINQGFVTDSDTEKELKKWQQTRATAVDEDKLKQQYKIFFIPWNVWRDMKEMYGRQYLKPDDIEEYKVKCDGAVHFLIHTEELKGAYENAERKR